MKKQTNTKVLKNPGQDRTVKEKTEATTSATSAISEWPTSDDRIITEYLCRMAEDGNGSVFFWEPDGPRATNAMAIIPILKTDPEWIISTPQEIGQSRHSSEKMTKTWDELLRIPYLGIIVDDLSSLDRKSLEAFLVFLPKRLEQKRNTVILSVLSFDDLVSIVSKLQEMRVVPSVATKVLENYSGQTFYVAMSK